MQRLAYSTLVVLWWVGIWGITDWIVHHISGTNAMKKLILYIGLSAMVAGTVALSPDALEKF